MFKTVYISHKKHYFMPYDSQTLKKFLTGP